MYDDGNMLYSCGPLIAIFNHLFQKVTFAAHLLAERRGVRVTKVSQSSLGFSLSFRSGCAFLLPVCYLDRSVVLYIVWVLALFVVVRVF